MCLRLKVGNTGKSVDLTGQRFGMLTVLGESKEVYIDSKRGWHYKKWDCQCDCGNIVSYRTSELKKKGKAPFPGSCGCERNKNIAQSRTKHGDCRSRLYEIWSGMKKRCYNKNSAAYDYYGGKGVRMCDEWLNSYDHFKEWALNNGYDDRLSIDRIDNDGDYCPENCRWANNYVQSNNKSTNHYIIIDGVTHTMKEWSDIYQMPYYIVIDRINNSKWDPLRALTEPIKSCKKVDENNGASKKSQ